MVVLPLQQALRLLKRNQLLISSCLHSISFWQQTCVCLETPKWVAISPTTCSSSTAVRYLVIKSHSNENKNMALYLLLEVTYSWETRLYLCDYNIVNFQANELPSLPLDRSLVALHQPRVGQQLAHGNPLLGVRLRGSMVQNTIQCSLSNNPMTLGVQLTWSIAWSSSREPLLSQGGFS